MARRHLTNPDHTHSEGADRSDPWPYAALFQGAAERLRAARDRAGLTREAVSQRTGVGFDTYWDLEHDDSGLTTVSLDQVRAVADCVGLDPVFYLTGEDRAQVGAGAKGPEGLADILRDRLGSSEVGLEESWRDIGWDLSEFLASPDQMRVLFNVDCLVEVCSFLELEWSRFV